MKLIKYLNEEWSDEAVLVEVTESRFNLITKGDYYHDKIDEYIDRFTDGLSYAGITYDLEVKRIDAKDKMFEELEFYNPNPEDE